MMVAVCLLSACSGNDRVDDSRVGQRTEGSTTSTAEASTNSASTNSASSSTTSPTTTAPSTHLLDSVCNGRAATRDLGVVTTPEIGEASGIVASGSDPGVWWINNDSGDSARIFAVNEAGSLLATVDILNAQAVDWEDIASNGDSIFIADTGDNRGTRDSVTIYAIQAPALTSAGGGRVSGTTQKLDATATKLTLTYPDGPQDAEALAFDPDSGDLFIITKDWSLKGVSGIYRTPANPLSAPNQMGPNSHSGGTVELERVGDLSLPAGSLVTGADISSDGRLIAVRTYTSVNLFRRPPDTDVATALESVPCEAPLPPEVQGEAIGFSADGSGYVTMSEGKGQTLHLTHG